MWHEDTLIAEAKPCEFTLDLPSPPNFATAADASTRYSGFHHHPYPQCFVCGPRRPAEDGLKIFAGPLLESEILAATWIPAPDLADDTGFVKSEFVWAALDCPGGVAAMDDTDSAIILGRLAAKIMAPVKAGEGYIPMGWHIYQEGRKCFSGTALYSASGELCGLAKATWITL